MTQQSENLGRTKERIRWVLLIVSCFVLSSSVLFIVTERMFLPNAWYPYQFDSLSEALRLKPTSFQTGNQPYIYSRNWEVSETSNVELKFSARVSQRVKADLWGTSTPSLLAAWVADSSGGYTHVATPTGTDPYIFRSVKTDSSVAGQRFQVEVQMRSQKAIPAVGCRGIWLQENGGKYLSQCFPVALNKDWRTFRFEWVAPKEATSASLRTVINDFDGLEYDVKNLVLKVWSRKFLADPRAARTHGRSDVVRLA